MRGAAAVRGFVWLAALAPFLAHGASLELGGEDLFWLGVVAVDAAWRIGRRRTLASAAPLALGIVLAAVGSAFPPSRLGPEESDWQLVSSPGVELPAGPSARHWLGTDSQGRDLLARLLFGTRVSLGVGAAATAIAVTIGIGIGLLCGTLRGAVDLLLMRLVEVMLCFPHLFLVLVVFAYLPHSRAMLIVLLGLVGWTTTARLVRGELLRLQREDFVLAARSLGASPARLALRHLLPNALAPVLVAATFSVAGAMLAEFSLSWLGLGVAPPTPSLGSTLAEGQRLLMRGIPWIALAPGILIFAVVMSFNAWGESLRAATTPERRPRAATDFERRLPGPGNVA
jgi:peptide/nickel transport system permease protein